MLKVFFFHDKQFFVYLLNTDFDVSLNSKGSKISYLVYNLVCTWSFGLFGPVFVGGLCFCFLISAGGNPKTCFINVLSKFGVMKGKFVVVDWLSFPRYFC